MPETLNRLAGASLALVLTTLAARAVNAQIPCVDGMAAGYPCQNIDFMSYLSSDEVGEET